MEPEKTSLRRHILAYRGWAVVGFLCVVGYIGGSLTMPLALKLPIDGLLTKSLPEGRLLGLVALVSALGVFTGLVSIGMRRILIGLGYRIEYDLRKAVFTHLTRLDQTYYHRERTGDIMTKMTSDLSAVREMIGQGLLQGSRIALGFPFAFTLMYATSPAMTAAVALILPFVSALFFVSIRLIHKHYDRTQDQFSAITSFCQETFAGFRTVKGFGVEDRQRSRFRELNDEYIRRSLTLSRIEEPLWPFMMFLYWVGAVLLLLIGGRQVIRGEITLGAYVQFQQYLLFLQWPMLSLGFTINLFQRGRTSWKRLRTILDAQPVVRDAERTDTKLERVDGEIVFENIVLKAGERTLLDIPRLVLPAGEQLGITGPTGSGKTLLISLILRLIDPDAGRVTIGGRDVREFPVDALRRRIGLAPQEPFLFSDTIANNLAFGLEPVEDAARTHAERITWAADIASLSGEVATFPEGYGTMLGERGVTLSGGQRQRTAIGRALARRPDVLILDDVFSAVDTQTEARILERLLPELAGRTSILISHRVSTLRHARRILVIENGRIAQDGSHEQLVATPGYYRDLDEIQRLEARLETA